MLLFVTLAVLLLRAEPLWGFAAGAPRSACRTMRPDHGRHITPQSTNHPYHIEVSEAYYKERQVIQGRKRQYGLVPFRVLKLKIEEQAATIII